jgi:hypothetical protein
MTASQRAALSVVLVLALAGLALAWLCQDPPAPAPAGAPPPTDRDISDAVGQLLHEAREEYRRGAAAR